jgi:hypothetical protein
MDENFTEEFRTFKCWRYRINTTIRYVYEADSDGNQKLVNAYCSLQRQGKRCYGMQGPDRPCPLISVR